MDDRGKDEGGLDGELDGGLRDDGEPGRGLRDDGEPGRGLPEGVSPGSGLRDDGEPDRGLREDGEPDGGLREENERLRRDLAVHERSAAEKEQQLERYAADLRETFKQERERTLELQRSYMATVRALANAVEARDAYTGKHAERVAAYALEIAREAGLDLAQDREIEFGFLLHDIGKVAVPDAILFKPDRLTPQERLVVEQHPVTGSQIVREIDFLGQAREVIRSHHERWDGGGYPDGLAGEDIPLAARVFSVADVLDALTTDRPYRVGSPIGEAREMIVREVGTHFDPGIIRAFGRISDATFERIRGEIG